MGPMSGRACVAAALAVLVVPWPAAAIPVGPPTVEISAERTDDPLVWRIDVRATDPDGVLRTLDLCVDRSCTRTAGVSTFEDEVRACVEGSSSSTSLSHRFSGYGTYLISARVTAGGCPVLGAEEVAEDVYVLDVEPPPPPPPPVTPVECADSGEPRATDTGVSADRVRIGVAGVRSGPRSSFQGGASRAIDAVVRAVNEAGGVCGRLLELVEAEESLDGSRQIAALASDTFALVAMPDYRSLQEALAAGTIDGVPVVGTSGQSAAEFRSPWVWSVGTARPTFADLAVRHSYDGGARRFGIVWASDAPWAREARDSVAATLGALRGAELVSDVEIYPARASYSAEIQRFNEACSGVCDGVIYALEPQTALTWIAGRPTRARIATSLVPQLFNEYFASSCGKPCQDFLAWTGFEAPIGHMSESAHRYRDALAPGATINELTESAYVGTYLLAQALGRAGVDLTRPRLREVLDAQEFYSGLTATVLSYSARRDANHSMRGYSFVYAAGAFAGFRDETGWQTAP